MTLPKILRKILISEADRVSRLFSFGNNPRSSPNYFSKRLKNERTLYNDYVLIRMSIVLFYQLLKKMRIPMNGPIILVVFVLA